MREYGEKMNIHTNTIKSILRWHSELQVRTNGHQPKEGISPPGGLMVIEPEQESAPVRANS
jgi:hypothetical protein